MEKRQNVGTKSAFTPYIYYGSPNLIKPNLGLIGKKFTYVYPKSFMVQITRDTINNGNINLLFLLTECLKTQG